MGTVSQQLAAVYCRHDSDLDDILPGRYSLGYLQRGIL